MSRLQDLAEAYVLGVLDTGEQTAVDGRLADPRSEEDRALAEAVGRVRDKLLPLDLTAPELPLARGAWERLRKRLDGAPSAPPVEPLAPPEPPAAAPAPRGGWRLAAMGAMAAALLLAAALARQLLLAPDPAVLVLLLDDGGAAVAVLEAYPDNSVVVTPLEGVVAGPSQVLQLWTKPDPDGPPVSVGLLQTVARMVVRNASLPAPERGQLYEITLEPEGGSPTGLPTGPIIGVGNAQVPIIGEG